MFEENEILTQIRALRQEVGSRLDDMDLRLRKIEADISSPAMQGIGSRLDEVDLRLRRLEDEVTTPLRAVPAPAERQAEYVPPPPAPTRTIEVTINPLNDVSRVRVVEAALVAIDGVQSVSLLTLSGDSAQLTVEAGEDVSLIGGLRRTLPLAFDVHESNDTSFTLALAQPLAEPRQGEVFVHKAQ